MHVKERLLLWEIAVFLYVCTGVEGNRRNTLAYRKTRGNKAG